MTSKKNLSEWYHWILEEADVVDGRYPIKGMLVYKKWGLFIIREMQRFLEEMLEESGHQPVDSVGVRVRNGHPAADPGAHDLLALDHVPEDPVEILDEFLAVEVLEDPFEKFLFRPGFDVQGDILLVEEFRQLHGIPRLEWHASDRGTKYFQIGYVSRAYCRFRPRTAAEALVQIGRAHV